MKTGTNFNFRGKRKEKNYFSDQFKGLNSREQKERFKKKFKERRRLPPGMAD